MIIWLGLLSCARNAKQYEDGKWSGLNIEMIANIDNAFNFSVKCFGLDSIKQESQVLNAHPIDMLVDVAVTEVR